MPDLLLELRSEEIPARMQRKAAGDLKKLVTDALVEAGLTYEGGREYWTPRRLTLDLRGITARSADRREERKGPAANASAPAVHGFLKGIGIPPQGFSRYDTMTKPGEAVTSGGLRVEIREDGKKGAFFVATMERPGRPAEEIIAEVMPGIIRNFPWPKSMRWGAASMPKGTRFANTDGKGPESLKWVRPLQSIICLFGTEHEATQVIPFEIDGLVASNVTYGHRFHAPGPIVVRRFDDYVSKLEAAMVVLDAERRKQIIRKDAETAAFLQRLNLIEDEGLLEEVSGLVEWPQVLMGEFEREYLDIPAEIIRLTIKTNQKCFVTKSLDAAEGLSNKFVLVANIDAKDGGREIVHGNGKVVRARLSDARHFWTRDQQDLPDLDQLKESIAKFDLDISKPLDQRMAKLDALNVTFHAKIGTQGDRVLRIQKLAFLMSRWTNANEDLVKRAAALAKADLRTDVVGEFPELQGLIGRKYALLQGEHESVAAAIEDHYKPQGPSDRVPEDPVAITIALADKIDTLSSFWRIGEKPTGSKDPYALRRAALGVVRIIIERKITFPLGIFVDADLLSFIQERLKVYLRDMGARHDLIDAVLAQAQSDDLLGVARRVEALTAFISSEEGKNILAGAKRATQLLAAEEKKGAIISTEVSPDLLRLDAERELFTANTNVSAVATALVDMNDYRGAMQSLATLRAPIDRFFVEVLVNDEDPEIRANRLALLKSIKYSTDMVADFSKITD